MSDTTHSTPRAIAQALRLIADALEAEPVAVATDPDPLLTLAEVTARYGMGRGALDARGIPKARYGRSYRWRAADIETAIRAEPPRPRKCQTVDESPIDAMLRSGELISRRGAR